MSRGVDGGVVGGGPPAEGGRGGGGARGRRSGRGGGGGPIEDGSPDGSPGGGPRPDESLLASSEGRVEPESEPGDRLASLARSTRRARLASRARLSVSPRCSASLTVSPKGKPGAEGEGTNGVWRLDVVPPTGTDTRSVPRLRTSVQPSSSSLLGGGEGGRTGGATGAGDCGRAPESGGRDVSRVVGADNGTTVNPKVRSSVASSVSVTC